MEDVRILASFTHLFPILTSAVKVVYVIGDSTGSFEESSNNLRTASDELSQQVSGLEQPTEKMQSRAEEARQKL